MENSFIRGPDSDVRQAFQPDPIVMDSQRSGVRLKSLTYEQRIMEISCEISVTSISEKFNPSKACPAAALIKHGVTPKTQPSLPTESLAARPSRTPERRGRSADRSSAGSTHR
jgi:hypothetical protein